MPWFGWYSKRQEYLFGCALYHHRSFSMGSEKIYVTQVSMDPEFKHPYKDSIKIGRLTHFLCTLGKGTKKRQKAVFKTSPEMKFNVTYWETSGGVKIPNLKKEIL